MNSVGVSSRTPCSLRSNDATGSGSGTDRPGVSGVRLRASLRGREVTVTSTSSFRAASKALAVSEPLETMSVRPVGPAWLRRVPMPCRS